jgi:hypothetical protein
MRLNPGGRLNRRPPGVSDGGGSGYNSPMRAPVALALLAGVLICSTTASSAPPANVKGIFVRTTSTTVCQPTEPCDPPPQAAFVVFTRNGRSTQVRIGATGAFVVHLAAGTYSVSARPSRTGSVSPATVRVPRVGVIHPRLVQRGLVAPA